MDEPMKMNESSAGESTALTPGTHGATDVSAAGNRGRITFNIDASKAWQERLAEKVGLHPTSHAVYACTAWPQRVSLVASHVLPAIRRRERAWKEGKSRYEMWVISSGAALVRMTSSDGRHQAVLQIPLVLARAKACGQCAGCRGHAVGFGRSSGPQ